MSCFVFYIWEDGHLVALHLTLVSKTAGLGVHLPLKESGSEALSDFDLLAEDRDRRGQFLLYGPGLGSR